ncbi:MAG: hypothetical protein AAB787_01595 [Patescibacteria group bacterium]|mgnify:CR=1 FL=1
MNNVNGSDNQGDLGQVTVNPEVSVEKPKRVRRRSTRPRLNARKKGVNSSRLAAKKNPDEIPDELPKKYFFKSTWNTHDVQHSPVEKTITMIDKILSGERLFTM